MCARASVSVCAFVIHYCDQNLSIQTANIHHHLPLTFLIAIDLFAMHKYLYRNLLLSGVLTERLTPTASSLIAHYLLD